MTLGRHVVREGMNHGFGGAVATPGIMSRRQSYTALVMRPRERFHPVRPTGRGRLPSCPLAIPLLVFLIILLLANPVASSQPNIRPVPTTYCNPLNLDYAFVPKLDYSERESHRSTADPAVVLYRDTLFLFSTNQEGYWWSHDLGTWTFVPKNFKKNRNKDDVCAPAALVTGDSMLFLPSIAEGDAMPLYLSTDPVRGSWSVVRDSFEIPSWDPALFRDDDGRIYLYWGSSNLFPIKGVELDPQRGYSPRGKAAELLRLHPDQHGWERFGENHMDTLTHPYIEGAWMTKHQGRYYLQYAAPGTEWNIYADGVYVGDHPLGPFTPQAHNPFSYKPGGCVTGAGHGSTFTDRFGNLWHAGTMLNWIKYKFERRLGVFPAGFDPDGVLYANTAYGDYPHYLPTSRRDHRESYFTGWMMLSYRKPTRASSSLPGKPPSAACDENIRTYWCAATGDSGEWLEVDLGAVYEVRAIQLNYGDDGAMLYGKQPGIYHRYRLHAAQDLTQWTVLVDKSENTRDVPHDYIEFVEPVKARLLRLENVHMPTGRFAIAGLRVFGLGPGSMPSAPAGLQVVRNPADRRNARLTWTSVPGAYAYNIRFGVDPGKLYNSILVHDSTNYDFRGMNVESPYFFTVEAVAETGVSPSSAAQASP